LTTNQLSVLKEVSLKNFSKRNSAFDDSYFDSVEKVVSSGKFQPRMMLVRKVFPSLKNLIMRVDTAGLHEILHSMTQLQEMTLYVEASGRKAATINRILSGIRSPNAIQNKTEEEIRKFRGNTPSLLSMKSKSLQSSSSL